MPRIYLSPSTQENNLYVTGGTEEQYMNLIADEMIPYLNASGIGYTRNTPDMTAASSIRQANSGSYDLYLALHSNAAPEGRYGTVRGTDVYFYPSSRNGRRAAMIFARNLKEIYPLPQRVRAVPTTNIGEVARSRAPAVLIELAYHDNVNDANWITSHIPEIARNLVQSLDELFALPFVEPGPVRQGRVSVSWGVLNIRTRPDMSAQVLIQAPAGAVLTVYGRAGDWYSVNYQGVTGFANAQYVSI